MQDEKLSSQWRLYMPLRAIYAWLLRRGIDEEGYAEQCRCSDCQGQGELEKMQNAWILSRRITKAVRDTQREFDRLLDDAAVDWTRVVVRIYRAVQSGGPHRGMGRGASVQDPQMMPWSRRCRVRTHKNSGCDPQSRREVEEHVRQDQRPRERP